MNRVGVLQPQKARSTVLFHVNGNTIVYISTDCLLCKTQSVAFVYRCKARQVKRRRDVRRDTKCLVVVREMPIKRCKIGS